MSIIAYLISAAGFGIFVAATIQAWRSLDRVYGRMDERLAKLIRKLDEMENQTHSKCATALAANAVAIEICDRMDERLAWMLKANERKGE